MKEQLAVEVEALVSPVEIWSQKVLSSVWGVPQVNERGIIAVRAIKNEILSLGMLKNQTNSNKETKKDSISILQGFPIFVERFRLCHYSPIIHVEKQQCFECHCLHVVQLHYWSDVQS